VVSMIVHGEGNAGKGRLRANGKVSMRQARFQKRAVERWPSGCVIVPALRHSREMTRVCSRKLTQRPAFGGDDNAFPTCGLRIEARRFLWVTLSAQKWVILGERRGAGQVRVSELLTVGGCASVQRPGVLRELLS
jgi:hypothetical protein